MKQLIFTILLSSLLAYTSTKAQNVGIGTTTPKASAILDVSSTTKGVLLPRMNTIQRNAIASPDTGLIIFNTDDMCTDVFNGTNWIKNCGLKQGDSATIPENNWIQKANFGVLIKIGSVGFSIGSKGYIGTGSNGTTGTNDFWEYNPNTNIWTQKADFVGGLRYSAVGFSIGSKGYIGTGFNDFFNSNDFWEYDPITNTWTQKANFGGGARAATVGFSIGSKGYIGTGSSSSNPNLNDFWEYNPTSDTWTQKANFGGSARYNSVGFSIGNKGYIGTGANGLNYYNDFWEFDPGTTGSLGSWAQKANFSGSQRDAAVGFSIGDKGYIGTGDDGTNKNDFWEFNPSDNTWIQKASFGVGRQFGVGFSIGSKGYIGLGYGNFYQNDFWEYNTVPTNVASYSTLPATLSQSNVSDASWTKTVLNEIKSNIGNVNIVDNKMGIGTSTPSEKLEVIGKTKTTDLQITSGAALNKILTSDANGNASWQTPITPTNFWTASGSNINNNNTGNVGIGNSDPSYILDLSKRMRLRSENTSQGAGIWFNNNNNTAENIFLGNDGSNNLQVYSYSGLRTIATFNPTTGGLRVEGPAAAASTNTVASFGGYGDFVVDAPGTSGGRFIIKENGNVGINNNNPTTSLDVGGFSKLGDLSPAFKMRKLTGTTSANGDPVDIYHGLTFTKILSVSVLIKSNFMQWVPPMYNASIGGYYYQYLIRNSTIGIQPQIGNSAYIANQPITIIVTYEE